MYVRAMGKLMRVKQVSSVTNLSWAGLQSVLILFYLYQYFLYFFIQLTR